MGSLTLKASMVENLLLMEIEDDGRGVDLSKVVRKAIEYGYVAAEEVENWSEEEKLELVFAPGFSTSRDLTKTSGRGVGMDAVRDLVHSIDGDITLRTHKGAGTSLAISFPIRPGDSEDFC